MVFTTSLGLLDLEEYRREIIEAFVLMGCLVLSDDKYLSHLSLSNRTERTNQLVGHRVFMQYTPHRHIQCRGVSHEVADNVGAFVLCIVVVYNIEQSVDEYNVWLYLPHQLKDLLISFLYLHRVAQSRHLEPLLWYTVRDASQRADTILDGDGIIFRLLGVDI